MFSGDEIVATLSEIGVSHVVWVPDSEIGKWETHLEASLIDLVRVCREGEAWPLAVGLMLGGAKPIVMMQTTGLFESGDALRHVVYDLEMPVFALIGARNRLKPDTNDSAARFAEPVLEAWSVPYVVLDASTDGHRIVDHYRECQAACQPGICLMAE